MEILDKIFYIRVILGAVAGCILGGFIRLGTPQNEVIAYIILTGLIFYIASYIAAKYFSKTLAKKNSRQIATNGIFPFIFILLMMMIVVFTAINQHAAE